MSDKNLQKLFIHTVLVRPIYPRNIGQSVRATMNMGYGKVFLIDPQCDITEDAHKGAAGAQKELDERTTYKDWEEFNKNHPTSFRIGMTRRIGKHRKLFPFETGVETYFNSLIEKKEHKELKTKEIFLIFGPEDHGLSTEDLDSANMCCHLPLYGEFKSLNLAQAVLLSQHIAHSIYFNKYLKNFLQDSTEKKSGDFLDLAVGEEFFPDDALLKWLIEMGFQIDPTRLNAFETIKKMILRGFPSQKELGTFEKALRQSTNAQKK